MYIALGPEELLKIHPGSKKNVPLLYNGSKQFPHYEKNNTTTLHDVFIAQQQMDCGSFYKIYGFMWLTWLRVDGT